MSVTPFNDPTYLEVCYQTLFEQISGAMFPAGISLVTKERIVVAPDEVAPALQPALFLMEGPLSGEQKTVQGPQKWIFTSLAMMYFRADGAAPVSGQQNPKPATLGNYLLWGLLRSLVAIPEGDRQTLGGLVNNCWVEGEPNKEYSAGQCLITVPIYMLPGPVVPY